MKTFKRVNEACHDLCATCDHLVPLKQFNERYKKCTISANQIGDIEVHDDYVQCNCHKLTQPATNRLYFK